MQFRHEEKCFMYRAVGGIQIKQIYSQEEGNVLFNNALNTFYFKVIWRQT